MRIVCMGTGEFIVPTFRMLVTSCHEVLAVVTRPERPGVGKKTPPPVPMRVAAMETSIPLLSPESINDPLSQQQLRELQPDLFVVCDYGQILSRETLGLAQRGGINLHGSLLPAYRGAAPVQWAIYDGCDVTGVTTIHMTPGLDAGPILTTRRLPIDPQETAEQLEHRLAEVGVEAMSEAIELLMAWDGSSDIGVSQDSTRATKAPRLKKTDGLVNWARRAVDIVNQVRAFQPWPLTYTHWAPSGKPPMRLVLDRVSSRTATGPIHASPGVVLQVEPEWLVSTGDGVLCIETVCPAGKRLMGAADFLRGHAVAIGHVLS